MYKTLLLDLDETLLDFKAAERAAITATLKKHSLPFDDDTVALYSRLNAACWKQYELGQIAREDIYTNRFIALERELGLYIDIAAISRDYFDILSLQGQTLPYAETLLGRLQKRGYLMAAATNGALKAQRGRIAASGLGKYFNGGIYISEVIGFKKPQPEFFLHILNDLGLSPADGLVIGDSQSSDIKGANAADIDCCYYNPKGEPLADGLKAKFTVSRLEDIISVCEL